MDNRPDSAPSVRRVTLVLLLALAWLAPAAAMPSVGQLPALSAEARVSLITEWPGDAVYFAFGHSALRVRDPQHDIDWLFNYGVFSFGGVDDPWFIARFVAGQTDYMLAVNSFGPDMAWDSQTQNRVWKEQVLNLRPDEANRLFRFLVDNAQPENAVYRYDFILDNCSTRIPLAFDRVFGPRIQYASPGTAAGKSFHRLIDEFVAKRPLWQFLFYIVLGRAGDQPVSARQAMFLPFYLSSGLDQATIDHDGRAEPLVGSTARVNDPAAPTDWDSPWLDPAFLLWPLLALVAAWTVRGWWRDHRSWRRSDGPRPPHAVAKEPVPARLADGLFFLAIGFAGAVVWFLTFISSHSAVKGNLNTLWLWPLHLGAACLVLAGLRRKWLGWYFLAAAASAVLPLLLWPVWPQAMHPTMIPLMALLALRAADQTVRSGIIEEKVAG